MDDFTIYMLKIYAAGYAIGVLPFLIFAFLQRHLKLHRIWRAASCAFVASITATPVFIGVGWLAVFVPISLGYWFAPSALRLTITDVMPETLWLHGPSFLITAVVGFLIGWFVKPVAANNSFKPNSLRESA